MGQMCGVPRTWETMARPATPLKQRKLRTPQKDKRPIQPMMTIFCRRLIDKLIRFVTCERETLEALESGRPASLGWMTDDTHITSDRRAQTIQPQQAPTHIDDILGVKNERPGHAGAHHATGVRVTPDPNAVVGGGGGKGLSVVNGHPSPADGRTRRGLLWCGGRRSMHAPCPLVLLSAQSTIHPPRPKDAPVAGAAALLHHDDPGSNCMLSIPRPNVCLPCQRLASPNYSKGAMQVLMLGLALLSVLEPTTTSGRRGGGASCGY